MKKTKIEELPGNSKSSKIAPLRETRSMRDDREEVAETKPKARRAISRSGVAVRRKRSLSQTIAEMLVGGSESVGHQVLNSVLLPAAKNTLSEMITTGLEMILFGESGGRRGRDRDRGTSRVSYGSYYNSRNRDRDDRDEKRPSYRDKFNLDEIYFKNGDDAADVLDQMIDYLDEYETISVADFFDLAGIDGATWAHDKFGWDDLTRAKCTHTRHGYAILFPKPKELE